MRLKVTNIIISKTEERKISKYQKQKYYQRFAYRREMKAPKIQKKKKKIKLKIIKMTYNHPHINRLIIL